MAQNDLKFDIEKMKDMQKKLSETATDLEEHKLEVVESLEELKKDWNTTAGKKFMSDVDTDWTVEVDKYIRIIGAMESLLEEAATQYVTVEEEIDKLKFYS